MIPYEDKLRGGGDDDDDDDDDDVCECGATFRLDGTILNIMKLADFG